jgi:tetratricopeptide (TPR) repeat protein
VRGLAVSSRLARARTGPGPRREGLRIRGLRLLKRASRRPDTDDGRLRLSHVDGCSSEGTLAINKRKILDAARKYAQKGAREKALREYHTLLKLDPRDAKLHLEIGDCYRRWGQIDEAIIQYARVAEQYKDDGFDARAVAVFKQILNLDPKRYTAYVSLSELYQRMGLDSEALSALQAAADAQHKEGSKREALELLRKMATLDPTNTTSRLKVAELLRQAGMQRDAVDEYQLVIVELERQGATEAILSVEERILELQPERMDLALSIGRRLVELGKAGEAEPFARQVLEKDSEDCDAYELLIQIHKALANDEELAVTTRALAKIFRDRGDEGRARELSQRISCLDLEASPQGKVVEESESEFLHKDDLLDDDFLAPDLSDEAPRSPEFDAVEWELEHEAAEEVPGLGESDIDASPDAEAADDSPLVSRASAALPEGDPDQLLAEANVYLRYGKREQAILSLEAILLQDSEHRAALEKLGQAQAEGGDTTRAVELWSRAALRSRSDGDTQAFSLLRDRIAALDAESAAALEEVEPQSVLDEELDFSSEEEIEIEIDVDLETQETDEPTSERVRADDALPRLDEEPDGEASLPEYAVDEIEFEVDVDVEDEADAIGDDDDAEADVSSLASSGTTSAQQVSEDLEEAEFYYQQELFDEAEAVYRRILRVAPNHPSALLRLGELAAAKGNDPSLAHREGVEDAPLLEVAATEPVSVDAEPASWPGDDATEVAELSAKDDSESRVCIDVPASVEFSDADETVPLNEELEVEPAGESDSEGAGFDLAAELRDVIEDDEKSVSRDFAPLSTVDDGFESIFHDFKQGVAATLSEDDYETRYDLGIAYREMELYDDAIGEFRRCLQSPSRRLTSLHMMGLCALDLGRAADAVSHFEQVLSTPDLPQEQVGGLRFDLGRALEAEGDLARARCAYEAVLEADRNYPGLSERLRSLAAPAQGDAVVDLVNSEGFESFDDIITEAESAIAMTERAEGPLEPEPMSKTKSRYKKISFV